MSRPDEETLEKQPPGEKPPAPEAPTPPPEDWRDRYLRALADLDNYRKRMERERESARTHANEEFLRPLLPLLDALRSVVSSEGEVAALREGVRLALAEALRLLGEKGLEPIEAEGMPFDPRFHEACGMVPDASRPAGTVAKEILRGYRFRDRLLRASRVLVAVAPPAGEAEKRADPEEATE